MPVAHADEVGLACGAAAEVEVSTGHARELPVDLRGTPPYGPEIRQAVWLTQDTILIETAEAYSHEAKQHYFRRVAGRWDGMSAVPRRAAKASVELHLRESLNSPPKLFATDVRSHRERLALDPNPTLVRDYELGTTVRIGGELPSGQSWSGLLIYPAAYARGRRYPLVIQSVHGHMTYTDEFNLYGNWGGAGMGLGPDLIPAYPGQLLAARNIAVLRLWVNPEGSGPAEGEVRRSAFEIVAKRLGDEGLVDISKVGIVGYSRAGYHVEYTLAHSTFPFAAAIANDNYDPSYIQSALSDWRSADANVHKAEAFGSGLYAWLKDAPGFNVENVHSPLLMIGQTPGESSFILSKWEIFSRLRHLDKPVEMYVMPQIARFPTHEIQNPAQIVAIQQRVIDWFCFWLNGDEDRDTSKSDQYERWRELKGLRDADLKTKGPASAGGP
jgi:hypothetical protein